MQLLPFSVLFLFGFLTWYVGHTFSYKGVAAIGAAFILIAGSGVALTGLVVQDGHYETIEDMGSSNETHLFEPNYKPINFGGVNSTGALGSLGLGGLVMMLSAVLFAQTLSKDL